MTLIAFLRKAEVPGNRKIQETLQELGYDFTILNDPEKQIDDNGIECRINGHNTYVETYVDVPNKVIDEGGNCIKPDLTDQDWAISFVWGADFAAGACVGLISIALIDLSSALVYYMDDEIRYTREMLVGEMSQFIEAMNKPDNHS